MCSNITVRFSTIEYYGVDKNHCHEDKTNSLQLVNKLIKFV